MPGCIESKNMYLYLGSDWKPGATPAPAPAAAAPSSGGNDELNQKIVDQGNVVLFL